MLLLSGLTCFSQEEEGFVSLFNGKDLTQWISQKPGGFEAIDGEMVTRSRGAGYEIFTEKSYGNFILRLEFLLSEKGNSGVFIRCTPFRQGDGFEVQLLAPWTPWRDDLHCTGSMYGHVAVTNRPDETTNKWYRMEIRCDRKLVTISVNDQVTTMASVDTVKSMAGKKLSGVIGLQANHAEKQEQFAKFRNIRIRDLDSDPGYVIKGFYSTDEDIRKQTSVSAINLGASMVVPLARMMAEKNPAAKDGARQALFDIVAKASVPGASESMKRAVGEALKQSIGESADPITKDYLSWLSGMIAY